MARSTKRTTRQPSARRFALVVLDGGKSYTPIRDEFGNMEYELHYHGVEIGTNYENADSAEQVLNDYAHDQLVRARQMEAA